MTEEQKLIQRFCQSYVDWLNREAPRGLPYFRGTGLCANFEAWLMYENTALSAYDILKAQFVSEGLNKHYPFGHDSYPLGDKHLFPARQAWVRDHCNEEVFA